MKRREISALQNEVTMYASEAQMRKWAEADKRTTSNTNRGGVRDYNMGCLPRKESVSWEPEIPSYNYPEPFNRGLTTF